MSMRLEHNIFHSDLFLYSYEVDPFYHAKLAYYFQIAQEAASYHSRMLGCDIPSLQKKDKTWLIVRTHMAIARYATWPEEFSIETWAQKPWKLYFPRGTVATDAAGKELFHSMSQWVVMDLKTHHPTKPKEIVDAFGEPAGISFYSPDLGVRQSFETATITTQQTLSIPILYRDTDFNKHVNNVSYVSWIMESLCDDFLNAYKVSNIDISYLSQTYRHDTITIRTGSLMPDPSHPGEPGYVHEIVRDNPDGSHTPVCTAYTRWTPRALIV